MKWEYAVTWDFDWDTKNDEIFDELQRLGQEGWELITVDKGVAYFKRPLFPEATLNEVKEPAKTLSIREAVEAFYNK